MECQDNVPELYRARSKLLIQPHTPQTAEDALRQVSHEAEEQCILQGDRVNAVINYPAPRGEPKGSETPSGSAKPQILEILQPISCGEQRGAQVILCKTTIPQSYTPSQTTSSAHFVAKVFDPMYYGMPVKYGPWEPPMSLTRTANIEYSREAAAYEHIQKNKSSRPFPCSPEFYGCWSFQVQVPGKSSHSTSSSSTSDIPDRQRQVCLVLLEHVGGRSMDSIIVVSPNMVDESLFQKLDEQLRLNVWYQILQAYAWLEHIGIQHRDFAPRNVMIDPLPDLNEKPTAAHLSARVRIIDFNASYTSQPNHSDRLSLPTSPIVTWWTEFETELSQWCPRWWAKDLPRRRRWLWEKFGGDKRFERVEGCTEPDVLTENDHSFLVALQASPGY